MYFVDGMAVRRLVVTVPTNQTITHAMKTSPFLLARTCDPEDLGRKHCTVSMEGKVLDCRSLLRDHDLFNPNKALLVLARREGQPSSAFCTSGTEGSLGDDLVERAKCFVSVCGQAALNTDARTDSSSFTLAVVDGNGDNDSNEIVLNTDPRLEDFMMVTGEAEERNHQRKNNFFRCKGLANASVREVCQPFVDHIKTSASRAPPRQSAHPQLQDVVRWSRGLDRQHCEAVVDAACELLDDILATLGSTQDESVSKKCVEACGHLRPFVERLSNCKDLAYDRKGTDWFGRYETAMKKLDKLEKNFKGLETMDPQTTKSMQEQAKDLDNMFSAFIKEWGVIDRWESPIAEDNDKVYQARTLAKEVLNPLRNELQQVQIDQKGTLVFLDNEQSEYDSFRTEMLGFIDLHRVLNFCAQLHAENAEREIDTQLRELEKRKEAVREQHKGLMGQAKTFLDLRQSVIAEHDNFSSMKNTATATEDMWLKDVEKGFAACEELMEHTDVLADIAKVELCARLSKARHLRTEMAVDSTLVFKGSHIRLFMLMTATETSIRNNKKKLTELQVQLVEKRIAAQTGEQTDIDAANGHMALVQQVERDLAASTAKLTQLKNEMDRLKNEHEQVFWKFLFDQKHLTEDKEEVIIPHKDDFDDYEDHVNMAGFGQHTSGESEDWYKACLPEKHELRLLNICDAYVRAEKQKIQLCLTAPDKLTMSIGAKIPTQWESGKDYWPFVEGQPKATFVTGEICLCYRSGNYWSFARVEKVFQGSNGSTMYRLVVCDGATKDCNATQMAKISPLLAAGSSDTIVSSSSMAV
mmetsp:Transcript_66812/g.164675  ORF Transcript_66812/g.164675 Transcript_66812/m.164675 type:complete len:810 (+) Transcript_66812:561-2990(+)